MGSGHSSQQYRAETPSSSLLLAAAALSAISLSLFYYPLPRAGSGRSWSDLGHLSRSLTSCKVGVADWLEAFAAHPRIGDVEGLRKKYGGFADMSRGEQAGASGATSSLLQASELWMLCLPAKAGSLFMLFLSSSRLCALKALAEWNKRYEDRFGHIFLICASGKSAAEMLEAVKSR